MAEDASVEQEKEMEEEGNSSHLLEGARGVGLAALTTVLLVWLVGLGWESERPA